MNDRELQLRERLTRAPKDAEALRELAGLVGARRGGRAEVVELWSRYLEVVDASGRADALLALARAQVEARQSRGAIETLRRCTEEAPDSVEAFDLLGELLRGAGELEAAVEALRRAAHLDPQAIRPRLALVSCLDGLGCSGEAERELAAVRALGSSDPAIGALVMALMQRRG